jgi:hypothetical protein
MEDGKGDLRMVNNRKRNTTYYIALYGLLKNAIGYPFKKVAEDQLQRREEIPRGFWKITNRFWPLSINPQQISPIRNIE